jgi:hypothetical protein
LEVANLALNITQYRQYLAQYWFMPTQPLPSCSGLPPLSQRVAKVREQESYVAMIDKLQGLLQIDPEEYRNRHASYRAVMKMFVELQELIIQSTAIMMQAVWDDCNQNAAFSQHYAPLYTTLTRVMQKECSNWEKEVPMKLAQHLKW